MVFVDFSKSTLFLKLCFKSLFEKIFKEHYQRVKQFEKLFVKVIDLRHLYCRQMAIKWLHVNLNLSSLLLIVTRRGLTIFSANYTFHPFHLSWKEAALNCTKRQSSLASVDNRTSLNQLLNQSSLVLQDVWIGNVLSYEPMNGSFISKF